MNGKTQRGKQLQGKLHGGCTRRSALAWILCVALVFGGIWVPETGRSVQAEELAKVSDEMFAENPIEEYTSSEDDFSSEENYASWDAADVSEMSLNSAEDDIASGTYENITWRIDAEGTLTVDGTGEFSDFEGFNRAPWYKQSGWITSAVVRVTGMQNASYMFYDCRKLTNVDVSGFDTSSVTNMSCMFA